MSERAYEPSRDRVRNRTLAYILIGLGLVLLLNQAGRSPFGWGSSSTHPFSEELRGIEQAEVQIDWGRGPLRLTASSDEDTLVEGSVTAREAAVIDVDYDDELAEVSIRDQPRGWLLFRDAPRASGEVRFNPAPTYQFDLDTGRGDVTIDLSELRVSELELDSGSGDVALQLPREGDTKAMIDTGNGDLSITLPQNTAAQITIDRGSGSLDIDERFAPLSSDEDDVYQTRGYDEATNRAELKIDGGSGNVTIR